MIAVTHNWQMENGKFNHVILVGIELFATDI